MKDKIGWRKQRNEWRERESERSREGTIKGRSKGMRRGSRSEHPGKKKKIARGAMEFKM